MPDIIQFSLLIDDRGKITNSEPKQYAAGLRLWDIGCQENGSREKLLDGWIEAVTENKTISGLRVTFVRPTDGVEYFVRLQIVPLDTMPRTFHCTGRILMETEHLTDREKDVLRLVAMDLSTNEIAERLGVVPRTVNQHIESLKTKLNVNGLAGLGRASALFRIE